MTRDKTPALSFNRIIRGALIILTSSVISRLMEFSVRVLIGKALGPSEFGTLSALIGVVSVISSLILLGLPSGLLKFVSERWEDENIDLNVINTYVRVTFLFVLLLSLIASLLMLVFDEWWAILIFGKSQYTLLIHVILISLPFTVGLTILLAALQALKEPHAYALINNLLTPGIRLIGVIMLISLGLSFNTIVSFYAWGAVSSVFIFALGYMLIKYKRFLFYPQPFIESIQHLRNLLFFSLPLLLGFLLSSTVWQLDTVWLQRVAGAEVAGLYAAALTVGRLPNMVLIAFGFVITPYMAQYYHTGSYDEIQHIYGRAIESIFILGLLIIGIFLCFSHDVIITLFGTGYLKSERVFQVIALGYFIHSILGPNGNTLMMFGKSKLFLVDTSLAALVSVILYAVLIPVAGLWGATWATLAGLTVMNLLFSYQIYQLAGINPLKWLQWKLFGVIFISGLFTFGLMELIGVYLSLQMKLISECSVLACSYFILAIALKIIKVSDFKLLWPFVSPH